MNRRDFLRGTVVFGGPLTAVGDAAEPKPARRVIDAHCHAGKGLNYGQADAALWTTFNDPAWLLRQAQEAGIEQSVIFPISNVTYDKAIEAAKHLPNLYLETSSVVFFPYLERAAQELPAEKLLFGSDGPLVDPRVELFKIRLLKLPPEKEELVVGGNIRRLLHL